MKRSAPTTAQASSAGYEHPFVTLHKICKIEEERCTSGQFAKSVMPDRGSGVPDWSFKPFDPDEVKRCGDTMVTTCLPTIGRGCLGPPRKVGSAPVARGSCPRAQGTP